MQNNEHELFAEFEKSFEPVSTRSLNHLAYVALREAHQTDRLAEGRNGTSRIWHAEKPDWLCYERASYIYTTDKDNQTRRLRYLHTRVEHQDMHNDRATVETTSSEDGWLDGTRLAYDLTWGDDRPPQVEVKEEQVPSLSEEEQERLHTLLLMKQIDEAMVGEETMKELEKIDSLAPTRFAQYTATPTDIAWIEENIIRLNQRYKESDGVLRLGDVWDKSRD